jgi:hypothetical protein
MWCANKKPSVELGTRRDKINCQPGLLVEKVIKAELYGRGKAFMLALPASKSDSRGLSINLSKTLLKTPIKLN